MNKFDPLSALKALGLERPVFHSEADLQHALAWKVAQLYPSARVRLEVPSREGFRRSYLDMSIQNGSEHVGIELKYLTAALDITVDGERFHLVTRGAQDIGRYDVIKDVARLEQAVLKGALTSGWMIAVSNDPSYWAALRNEDVGYAQFALNEGRDLTGCLGWGPTAGPGTRRGREQELVLEGNYKLRWLEFSHASASKNGLFRALAVALPPPTLGGIKQTAPLRGAV